MSNTDLPSKKIIWRTHLRTSENVYQLIKEDAQREERSVAAIVSRIVAAHYQEKKTQKLVR